MKHLIVTFLLIILSFSLSLAQDDPPIGTVSSMYVKGIEWKENDNQDSIIHVWITGDTMSAIKSLLTYAMEESMESGCSRYLLDRINLKEVSRLFKDPNFDFYLAWYKKTIEKNKRRRLKSFGPDPYLQNLYKAPKHKSKH